MPRFRKRLFGRSFLTAKTISEMKTLWDVLWGGEGELQWPITIAGRWYRQWEGAGGLQVINPDSPLNDSRQLECSGQNELNDCDCEWGEWVGWVLWDRHSDQMYQKSQISGIALVVFFNNGHYLLNTYSVTYSVTREPIELSWDSWKYWFQCVHICCRYTRRQTLWLLSNVKLWRGHYTARAVTWQLNPQISHFLFVLVTIWSVYAAHHHQLLVPRSPWSRWSP